MPGGAESPVKVEPQGNRYEIDVKSSSTGNIFSVVRAPQRRRDLPLQGRRRQSGRLPADRRKNRSLGELILLASVDGFGRQRRCLRAEPDALDHGRGGPGRGRRRDSRPRRRPGRLGGADGGRARRRGPALRLYRRRDRHGPAPAARAGAVRDAAGRDRRLERLLPARSPQRPPRAARDEPGTAADPPRDRRPLLGHLRGRARRRCARGLRGLPGRSDAARRLRQSRRRRPRQRHGR